MASNQSRKVLAQIGDSKAQSDGWFAKGGLPSELRESAARRLGVLALLTAVTFLSFSFVYAPAAIKYDKQEMLPVGLVCAACALLFSVIIYGVSRRRNDNPRLLLTLGIPYQIAMAVVIGIVDNHGSLEGVIHVRGWSGVAVWIFIFAVFVPNTPIRTLWVSSVVALMDPLTLLVGTTLGVQAPPLVIQLQMFAPTAVAVLTAVVASRINYSMGKKLHEARELGSYRLLELLGKGGMGEVWRAEHRLLARPAAVKLIQAKVLATDRADLAENVLLRFEREAQATALLQSEHTIELYDFGVATDGSLYYVMELLDGMDLEQLVQRFGPMPPERVVHCLLQVCDSLAEAHESGLVHRDIKPSNIFVCHRGLKYDYVKVLDFGLVKAAPENLVSSDQLTEEHAISGTPAYMVPEIIEGTGSVDGRADLYALGCVAYWLLSGKLVFEAESPMVTVLNHLRLDPVRLSTRSKQVIPPLLEALVHACLEKDPGKRPRSAEELKDCLTELDLAGVWTQESAGTWWRKNHKPAPAPPVDPLGATAAESETLLEVAQSAPDTVRERPPKSS